MGKLTTLATLGIGYVLGTRAGREQYEKIRAGASKLRNLPFVSKPLDRAGEYVSGIVRNGGERVTDKVADAVKERLFGMNPHSSQVVDGQVTGEAEGCGGEGCQCGHEEASNATKTRA